MFSCHELLLNAVNSSGAVSPEMRASASSTPVIMPERQRGPGSAWSPSIAACPAPSPLRAVSRHQSQHFVGGAHHHRHGDQRQRQPPAKPEKVVEPWVSAVLGNMMMCRRTGHHDRWRRQQNVVEEADRLAELAAVAAYSASQVPAIMPIGVAMQCRER